MHYFVRPHPTKQKPIVTPVKTYQRLLELMRQHKDGKPIRNISSGEDCVVSISPHNYQ